MPRLRMSLSPRRRMLDLPELRLGALREGDETMRHRREYTHHGQTKHPLYFTWVSMLRRCYNPKHKHFESYGGRGITVSKERHDINTFITDMHPSHREGLSLDRVDNNAPYCKENCKWSTATEQGSNKRNNTLVEIEGEIATFAQWRRRIGISKATVQKRVNRGMSLRDALTAPIDYRYSRGGEHANI